MVWFLACGSWWGQMEIFGTSTLRFWICGNRRSSIGGVIGGDHGLVFGLWELVGTDGEFLELLLYDFGFVGIRLP